MAKQTRRSRSPMQFLVFMGPVIVIYTLFMIYPLFDSMRLSLFAETKDKISSFFVGISNYRMLIGDEYWSNQFWNALKNNFIFFVINMLVQNTIALMLAALISLPKLKGSEIYRTLIFLPTLLSFVIIGFIWKLILSPLWGISENFMYSLGIGEYFAPWLGLESSALITVSLISVWQFIGIPMLLIYAAFLNIPHDIYEAASLDGASSWTIFWKIKVPLIYPTLGIITILTFVANFNAFDLIYTVQGAIAGPSYSTDIMGTLFYRTFFGFQGQLPNQHMGATIATVMFAIILSAVLVYFFTVQKRLSRHEF
ncbi:MAG: sugar ABC transporter permease [Proteobacteria bacterium]|nr:sugar ABC transporter permease [Pseudomonadota bacterium]